MSDDEQAQIKRKVMSKLQKIADLLRKKSGKKAVEEYNKKKRTPASDRKLGTVVFLDKKHRKEKHKKDLKDPGNW